jgi:predicted nuclease of predicted toxin-antitoxin system
VRLLLDENLSESVLTRLPARFAGSQHVRTIAGEGTKDRDVWRIARERGLVIVTLDSDFETLSVLHGPTPKVVWLALHNPSNARVLDLLSSKADAIQRLVEDQECGFLALRA